MVKKASFEAVELADVLKLTGVKLREQLRGKELSLYLIVGAADNYRAVFALPGPRLHRSGHHSGRPSRR